jgi:hypothetical protein
LQPPPLSNWNKQNTRQVPLPWAHDTRLQQLHPSLLTTFLRRGWRQLQQQSSSCVSFAVRQR